MREVGNLNIAHQTLQPFLDVQQQVDQLRWFNRKDGQLAGLKSCSVVEEAPYVLFSLLDSKLDNAWLIPGFA